MKKILIILLLSVLVTYAHAQWGSAYNQELYLSYVKGEMDDWEGILQRMSSEYEQSGDPVLLYDMSFAYYGYIGYLLSMEEKEKEIKKFLNQAMDYTKELEEELDGRHDVLALRAAMIGYRIVLSKFTSLFMGPKASKYINTAYESAETCFNCNTEMANMKFYTPKFLGGSKEEAIEYYEKAVEILENSPLKTDRTWIYMNTVVMLANAYNDTDQPERACSLYEQLLEYEPGADWIREDLYSKCEQK